MDIHQSQSDVLVFAGPIAVQIYRRRSRSGVRAMASQALIQAVGETCRDTVPEKEDADIAATSPGVTDAEVDEGCRWGEDIVYFFFLFVDFLLKDTVIEAILSEHCSYP